jgi:hypothetical protein
MKERLSLRLLSWERSEIAELRDEMRRDEDGRREEK